MELIPGNSCGRGEMESCNKQLLLNRYEKETFSTSPYHKLALHIFLCELSPQEMILFQRVLYNDRFSSRDFLASNQEYQSTSWLLQYIVRNFRNLYHFISTVYNYDFRTTKIYKELGYKLFNICENIRDYYLSPRVVYRIDASERRNIHLYFENMKKCLQAMIFRDPVQHLKKLSQEMREKIYSHLSKIGNQKETRHFRELCDKYVVVQALALDALSNKTNEISPDDQLFENIESIISMTSCPNLSRCLLNGRRAVVLSFANRKGDGEGVVLQALTDTANVTGCLEIVDMHYKIVLFRRAWFEKFPQIELNSIYEHLQTALSILQNEPDDVRMHWTRQFIFRLLCCLLGLGMRCRFLPNFHLPQRVLQESERLLKEYGMKEAEGRVQMFYFILKSRLHQLKCESNLAIDYIEKAEALAKTGQYNELEVIQDAKDRLYLSDAPSLSTDTETTDSFQGECAKLTLDLPPSYPLPDIDDHSNYVSLTNSSPESSYQEFTSNT
ncbi:uncharacterized protein LOC134272798 [Saccostrea cucullata]|uniref:uncharacterized protein LOC134272798 n=1 Tax=Saccostrea cuccullata TaxID=36930 RepID=UPI002ECFF8E2